MKELIFLVPLSPPRAYSLSTRYLPTPSSRLPPRLNQYNQSRFRCASREFPSPRTCGPSPHFLPLLFYRRSHSTPHRSHALRYYTGPLATYAHLRVARPRCSTPRAHLCFPWRPTPTTVTVPEYSLHPRTLSLRSLSANSSSPTFPESIATVGGL